MSHNYFIHYFLGKSEIPLPNGVFIVLFTFEYLENAKFWCFALLR